MSETPHIPTAENPTDSKENVAELEPPDQQEVKEFFDQLCKNRSNWHRCEKDIRGKGVYLIRLKPTLKEQKPIQRWMNSDDCRILYIGKCTGKRRNHHVLRNLKTLAEYCPKLGEEHPECQYLLVEVEDPRKRSRWESFLLVSYHFHFADRPPLNRNLPKAWPWENPTIAKLWKEKCAGKWTEIEACLK